MAEAPRPLVWAATLALGAGGGAGAAALRLPMPWLIGPQLVLAVLALADIRLFGARPAWPRVTRTAFVPVLGVMVGASFTPGLLGDLVRWWPSLLALSVFAVAAHAVVYAICRRVAGYDRTTAFYAAFPGGFVEATLMGERAGGDARLILVQHFLRIFLIVLAVPLTFGLVLGHPVGSAAGVALSGRAPASPPELLLLLAAAAAGSYLAHRLRIPAAEIAGAIFVSAVLYLSGTVAGAVWPVLAILTQLIVGTALGVGFAGLGRRDILRAAGVALLAFAATFTAALGLARLLAPFVGVPPAAVVLAFMPGGLTEMSLIAVTMQLATPFVVLHHLYRILFAVAVLPRLGLLPER